jgi:hypothetical protein
MDFHYLFFIMCFLLLNIIKMYLQEEERGHCLVRIAYGWDLAADTRGGSYKP